MIGGLGKKFIYPPTSGYPEGIEDYIDYAYPLFMVTATTKNLDSVSIECMQLHHNSASIYNLNINEEWFEGTEEGDTEGLFYFPDAHPIVIPVVDDIPIQDDAIEVEPPILYDLTATVVDHNIYHPSISGGDGGSGYEAHIALGSTRLANLSSLIRGGYLGEVVEILGANAHDVSYTIGYFIIESMGNLPTLQPDFGRANIVQIIHSFYPSGSTEVSTYPYDFDYETYPNLFLMTFMQEVDFNGDGMPDTAPDGEVLFNPVDISDHLVDFNGGHLPYTSLLYNNMLLNVNLIPYYPIIHPMGDGDIIGDTNLSKDLNMLDVINGDKAVDVLDVVTLMNRKLSK